MEVHFHRQFKKQFRRLPPKVREKFHGRLALLIAGENDGSLRVHRLAGSREAYESMNVTDDIRAIFQKDGNEITFYEIGSHSERYQ